MNVNVKLSLDDDARQALASYIAGKPVKRLATRADVNDVVRELLEAAIIGRMKSPPYRPPAPTPDTPAPESVDDFCSDECCRQNQLLQSRVNVLQHRLDTAPRR